MTSDKLYHYRARLLRVVDGDTIDVELDHGFERMRSTRRLRLLGVDTPERGQQGYHEATALTFDQLDLPDAKQDGHPEQTDQEKGDIDAQ